MAKFILTSRYIKNPVFANAGKLLQYMATRDGVEKLPKGIDNAPATKQQEKLIKSIAKNFPETKKSIEFEDYEKAPTKANASEFLSYFEENYADKAEDMKSLVATSRSVRALKNSAVTACSRRRMTKSIPTRSRMR